MGRSLAVVAWVLSLVACSSPSLSNLNPVDASTDVARSAVCTGGMVIACPCLGGGQGVQTCNAMSGVFGPCVCPGVDASATDVVSMDLPVDISATSDTGVDAGTVDVTLPADTGCPAGRTVCAGTCCPSNEVCQSGSCRACASGMTFIPGGTFTMGATGLCSAGSGSCVDAPPHPVTLSPFCIDNTEVTVTAFAACTASGCGTPLTGGGCNWGVSGRGNHPIDCVSWVQAQAYCQTVRGGNLPTEAQWEFAAGGSVTTGCDPGVGDCQYPWGTANPSDARLCWNGGSERNQSTCPVGSFAMGNSPWGLSDMAGNVIEWVRDCLAAYETGSTPVTDPDMESSSCGDRVYRGGGWHESTDVDFRAAYRDYDGAGSSNVDVGFRCAMGL